MRNTQRRSKIGNKDAHLTIPDNVKQSNDVGSARQILQNFDLSLDLLLLNRLQDLDNTLLVVDNVDSLENLRVLSAAYMGKSRTLTTAQVLGNLRLLQQQSLI